MAHLTSMTAVLAASDLERARRFWHDVFGLEPTVSDVTGDYYTIGGTSVLVYETSFSGTAKNTVLSIMTENLDADMAEFRSHGVVFHDYDFPEGLTTVDGVADFEGSRGAWFDDSEGNIIALMQPTDEVIRQMRGASASSA
ncbi:VOC family protein [Agromyces sp. SYSU T00194]|uniref:VOC family protein n=1 Tax=Agromyces chitinivorans TaxID=3158560 RepID=UPI00339421AD